MTSGRLFVFLHLQHLQEKYMQTNTASVTAKLCAYSRWINAGRYGLFNDYLAGELLGEQEQYAMHSLMEAHEGKLLDSALPSILLSRSAWAEGHLACFSQGLGDIQYVIMGAGLDTFAYRNTNPKIRIFEVDHPDTQREKRERIARLNWKINSQLIFTPVDFTRDSLSQKLLESGFNPYLPTFITILGVAYYLPFVQFASTVGELSGLVKAQSRLLFDFQIEGFQSMKQPLELAAFTSTLGEVMADGYAVSDVEALLFENGWQFSEHLSPSSINERYFHHDAQNLKAFDSVHFMAAAFYNTLFHI